MARNVRYANVCVVSHPAMPIAAAKSGRLDGDYYTILRRRWIINFLHAQRLTELLVNRGFHTSLQSLAGPFAISVRGDRATRQLYLASDMQCPLRSYQLMS